MCIWYRGIAEIRRKCQNDSLILLYHCKTYYPSRCSNHDKKKIHNIQLQRKFGCHSLEDKQWNCRKLKKEKYGVSGYSYSRVQIQAFYFKFYIFIKKAKRSLGEIGPSFYLRVCISQVYEKLYKEKEENAYSRVLNKISEA